MSLDLLYDNDQKPSPSAKPDSRRRRWSVPGWLPPVGLLLGFGILFAFAAGDRLLPRPEVDVVPALLFEARGEDASPRNSAKRLASGPSASSARGELLFQASGWIEPDPHATHITALEPGVIEAVHVLEGQRVSRGDLLVEFVDDDARIAVAEAQSEVARARGALAQMQSMFSRSRDELQRLEKLGGSAVPAQEIARARFAQDASRAEMAAAQAALQTAEVQLQRSELALSRMRIVSPMDGRILQLYAYPGAKMMLDSDDPLSAAIAVVYEPAKLQVRVDVPLADAARLFIGQSAEVTTDFLPDRSFAGEVTRIGGAADIQRNTLQAKVRILEPDDSLRPEMLCRVKFYGSSERASAEAPPSGATRMIVMVPESALGDADAGGSTIWVVEPNTNALAARSISLEPFRREGWVEAASGANAGEHIVLQPTSDLRAGKRVRPNLSETLTSTNALP